MRTGIVPPLPLRSAAVTTAALCVLCAVPAFAADAPETLWKAAVRSTSALTDTPPLCDSTDGNCKGGVFVSTASSSGLWATLDSWKTQKQVLNVSVADIDMHHDGAGLVASHDGLFVRKPGWNQLWVKELDVPEGYCGFTRAGINALMEGLQTATAVKWSRTDPKSQAYVRSPDGKWHKHGYPQRYATGAMSRQVGGATVDAWFEMAPSEDQEACSDSSEQVCKHRPHVTVTAMSELSHELLINQLELPKDDKVFMRHVHELRLVTLPGWADDSLNGEAILMLGWRAHTKTDQQDDFGRALLAFTDSDAREKAAWTIHQPTITDSTHTGKALRVVLDIAATRVHESREWKLLAVGQDTDGKALVLTTDKLSQQQWQPLAAVEQPDLRLHALDISMHGDVCALGITGQDQVEACRHQNDEHGNLRAHKDCDDKKVQVSVWCGKMGQDKLEKRTEASIPPLRWRAPVMLNVL